MENQIVKFKFSKEGLMFEIRTPDTIANIRITKEESIKLAHTILLKFSIYQEE